MAREAAETAEYDEYGQSGSLYDEYGQTASNYDEYGQTVSHYDEYGQDGQSVSTYDEYGAQNDNHRPSVEPSYYDAETQDDTQFQYCPSADFPLDPALAETQDDSEIHDELDMQADEGRSNDGNGLTASSKRGTL